MNFAGTKWKYRAIADMDFETKSVTRSMDLREYIEHLKRHADPSRAREIEEDGRVMASSVIVLEPDGAIISEFPESVCSPEMLKDFLEDSECRVENGLVRVPHEFRHWEMRGGELYFGEDLVRILDSGTISVLGGMVVFERLF